MVTELTVVMPVRDTPAPMLHQAIGSILNQTFRNFEFLILDDGSRDPSTIRCLKSDSAQDARIRLESGPPRGHTLTLNIGIERARGKFIARQDSDDWSDPQRFELQLAFLRRHPEIALCGSAAWKHQQDGSPLWRTRPAETHAQIQAAFPSENPFVHGSTIYRRDIALQVGGYREEFLCSQDFDFLWRLSDAAGSANLAEPLYHYRYSGASVSANRAVEQARAHHAAVLLASARRRGELEDVRQALESWSSSRHHREVLRASLRQADHLMLAGEYRRALREYRALLRSHPASQLAWAKLVRCGIFWSMPLAREACFR